MEGQVKPAFLLLDEMDYELRIRGIVTNRDMNEKRKILGTLLRKEKEGSPELVDPSYVFGDKSSKTNNTLDSISNQIPDVEVTPVDSLYQRLKARLGHVEARIRRMRVDLTKK
ncbi:hypothetical protein JTB14_010149 [Gonioctena quinquepunctata]|nr:hypothetical protein JTB14_010149 [Gonioctena quinquepunctata]